MYLTIFTTIYKYRQAAILVLLAGVLAYFYLDYKSMESEIINLQVENSFISERLDQKEATINQLVNDQQRIKEQFEVVNSAFGQIRKQNLSLGDRIKAINTSPKMQNEITETQKEINKVTRELNRCFEIISGAPLTEEEKAAENATSFNSSCPWFFDRR